MVDEIRKNEEIFSKIVIIIYRFGNWIFYDLKIPVIKQLFYLVYRILDLIFIRFGLGSEIPASVNIGKGLMLYHPYGIILNPGVVIGANVTIRHQVTIGNNGKNNGIPILGDNINIGAGAKIIGGIKIKSNTVIGANAVVNKNFHISGLLVGIPAVLRKEFIES